MKGFIRSAFIGSALSAFAVASAQNLVTNGDFENSFNHPSLAGWNYIGLVGAAPSTFSDVADAAYITLAGDLSQKISLTAGDTYDLSGESALSKLAADKISLVSGPNTLVSQSNVTGDFSYDFTVSHTGLYTLSFSSLNFGLAEVSDLSLTKVPQAVPEPGSIGALGIGLTALIRRKRAAK